MSAPGMVLVPCANTACSNQVWDWPRKKPRPRTPERFSGKVCSEACVRAVVAWTEAERGAS